MRGGNLLILIFIFFILGVGLSEAASLTTEQYNFLNDLFITHMNYFLSEDAVTSYGLPLTAYKVGDRARFGYSNPAEWGYLLQALIAASERGIITESEAVVKIDVALNTVYALQQDPNQNYHKLFYPYYKVTNSAGNDVFPYHDYNVMIPSIDNGLLYMSLLVVEGWAKQIGNAGLENKARTIKDQMGFRVFLFTQGTNKYLAHTINADTDQLSSSKWDIFADEGGLMTLIAYFSDSVDFRGYIELTDSQIRSSATWDAYTVQEAAWFNAMFTWGVRSLSGFKVIGTSYSTDSLVPTTRAHLAYGDFIGVDYPGFSDAMSQVGGVGRYTPPNLANQVPLTPPLHITPHAFFVPFNILPDLDQAAVQALINKISLLKNDAAGYYHNSGLYPYGFEVIASPYTDDTEYSGSSDGRLNFETLSEAYTALSLFNAFQYADGSNDFYDLAISVFGYEAKVNTALTFLYSCSCSEWLNQGCGASGCSSLEMHQTRVCSPAGCNIEEGCSYSPQCEPPITVCKSGLCDYTTIQGAIDAAETDDVVLVTDKGVYEENIKFGGFGGKSRVTLDCNGATLLGKGSDTGISMSKGRDSTIKNCIITNYNFGIYQWDGVGHSFINNKAFDNSEGFHMHDNNNIKLIGNKAYDNREGIHFYWDGSGHIIKDNIVENNDIGIRLFAGPKNSFVEDNIVRNNRIGVHLSNGYGQFTRGNYISRNIIATNTEFGLYVIAGNTFYHNNIIDNLQQAYDFGNSNWDYNGKGNYWSDYDEPSEGCIDANVDDICDSPYIIDLDSQDNYPLSKKEGLYCTGQPDGTPCDDGLYCTVDDVCDNQVCIGLEKDCSDGVGCTVDSCDEVDDICINDPIDSMCNDGLYCNGAETCDAILDCQTGTPPNTDDSVSCTDDICDEVNDIIVNTPNDANCDDSLWCSGVETCDPALDCQTGTPIDCSDAYSCTNDSCDEENDICINTENDINCPEPEFCYIHFFPEPTGCGKEAFIDVPRNYWSWYEVEELVRSGITTGCTADNPETAENEAMFCPDDIVNREQMAAFIIRVIQETPYNNPTPTFEDVPISHWAYGYIERLVQLGITTGCKVKGEKKYYCPTDPVKRDQMAVFLSRAAGIEPYNNPAPSFVDVSSKQWAYSYIEAIYRAGITTGCKVKNGKIYYCPGDAVSRAQMATFLVRAFNLD